METLKSQAPSKLTDSLKQEPEPPPANESQVQNLLVGKLVKLVPYNQEMSQSVLYNLWMAIEQDDAWATVIMGRTNVSYPEFLKQFQGTYLLLVSAIKENKLAGVIWFSDHIPSLRIFASIWMRKGFGGIHAEEATRLATVHIFDKLPIESIWATSSSQPAIAHAIRSGFKRMVTLPRYLGTSARPLDVTMLRMTREEWVSLAM